ncbi:MAG TPA: hypothetical protein VJB92_00880 [Candidatus Paceibacterota bacterium]
MRSKYLFFGAAALMAAVAFSFFINQVAAQRPSEEKLEALTYPIPELGNCKSPENCASYCDKSANLERCIAYAENHDLMPAEEIADAKKFLAAGGKGPGGCTSKDACETYCNDINHMDECISFAEKNNIIPLNELAEAKKVQAALKGGAKLPGNCRNKTECEAYCQPNNPDLFASRMEECIGFAKTAGFMEDDELAEAEKALAAIKRGIKPPPCRGREACDEYCQRPENIDSCLDFAEAAGFIPPEEIARVRKMARLGITSGPGGCRGEEECQTFCENEANQETCSNFLVEILEKNPELKIEDFIREEDRERMQDGMEQMQEALTDAPDEVRTCLNEAFPGLTEKIESGNFSPIEMMKIGPRMGLVMQECFEKSFGGGPGGFGGPEEMMGEDSEFIAECFKELGMEFPPKKPPSPDLMSKIQTCMQNKLGAEGFPGAPDEFPGGSPAGGFPGGGMPPEVQRCLTELGIQGAPTPEQQGQIGECVKNSMGGGETEFQFERGESGEGMEGFVPPEGFQNFVPPENIAPEQFQEQFNEQYRQEYERQYQEQLQQQLQQYPGGYPSGGTPTDPTLECSQRGGIFRDGQCILSRFNPPSLLSFLGLILGIR